jgi:hypothetical protein
LSGFEVTTSELNAAQVYVSDVAGEIRSSLTSLASDVEELLGGSLEGHSSDRIRRRVRHWCR